MLGCSDIFRTFLYSGVSINSPLSFVSTIYILLSPSYEFVSGNNFIYIPLALLGAKTALFSSLTEFTSKTCKTSTKPLD
ncbi:hypothetical protein F4779DRAFT_408808 [Xylariaceae sp. FL0662B]|nr:hypothetical protein F4779DRAFT_408808 [Xylariaceae sp. FL0662B]